MRNEERELAPQATPRVFWLASFFCFLVLVLERDVEEPESKLRLDLWPEERDESKLIVEEDRVRRRLDDHSNQAVKRII